MSEIIDYLSEKVSTVAEGTKNTYEELKDYVQTGLESAKETLQKNAKNICKTAVRTGATALTAAMLVGGLTGCDVNNINPDNINPAFIDTTFPTTELKDYDEIVENGITDQDLIDKLNVVATKIIHNDYKDIPGFKPEYVTAQFLEIKPSIVSIDTDGDGLPNKEDFTSFYYLNEQYEVTPDISLNNVYEAEMIMNVSKSGTIKQASATILLSQAEFELLANALNITYFKADSKFHADHNTVPTANSLDSIACESFDINKNSIQGWPTDAKWILWLISDSSLTSLTIEHKFPDKQIDLEEYLPNP